jgi:hypothetical protein
LSWRRSLSVGTMIGLPAFLVVACGGNEGARAITFPDPGGSPSVATLSTSTSLATIASPSSTRDDLPAPAIVAGPTTPTPSPVPVLVASDPDLECIIESPPDLPPVALTLDSNKGDGPCITWIDEYDAEDGFLIFVWFGGIEAPRAYQTPANTTSLRVPPADYPPQATAGEGCPRAWDLQVDVRALVSNTIRIVGATALTAHPFDCPTVEQ